MANLYTKTGDKGQTSLVGGLRVSKSDMRVDCYGTIDEANSMLGLSYSQTDIEYIRAAVKEIQKRLFSLGAELASDGETAKKLTGRINSDDISYLEGIVDYCTSIVGKQTAFVIPGVDKASATLHVARTIVRRAERAMVELSSVEDIEQVLLKYVNRLSDAIYAMARLQEETTKASNLKEQVTDLVKKAMNNLTIPVEKPPLTLEVAEIMAKRAREKSIEIGVPIVFAVVDQGGNLILLNRMADSFLGSIEVAIGKAYTANAFKMPTDVLGSVSQSGQPLYGIETSAPGKIILFGGGAPYKLGETTLGGIGVSGGTVEQDMEILHYAMSF